MTSNSLKFRSGRRERQLLRRGGRSFAYPVMEDELGREDVAVLLHTTEDLSLKAYVTARTASRRLRRERKKATRRVSASAPTVADPDAALVQRVKDLEDALASERQKIEQLSSDVTTLQRSNLALV